MNNYQILTLIIAALGGIPGLIILVKVIYRKTSIRLNYDEKQSFVCQMVSDNNSVNNKYCFGFYGMSLVGHGDKPTTPKEINFYIGNRKCWIKGQRIAVRTHNIRANDNCIVFYNGIDALVVMNWFNFTPTKEALTYGKPLTYSDVYWFDEGLDVIKKCKYMRFFVEDYIGKSYKFKMKIKPDFFKFIDKGMKIIDTDKLPPHLLQLLQG